MSGTVKNHYGSAIIDDKIQVSFMCAASEEIIATADDAAWAIVSFIEVNILLPMSCGGAADVGGALAQDPQGGRRRARYRRRLCVRSCRLQEQGNRQRGQPLPPALHAHPDAPRARPRLRQGGKAPEVWAAILQVDSLRDVLEACAPDDLAGLPQDTLGSRQRQSQRHSQRRTPDELPLDLAALHARAYSANECLRQHILALSGQDLRAWADRILVT
jgi:hypothetical protein